MSRFLAVDRSFDPSHRFQTSWLLSPLVLGGIRLLISVYVFQYLFYKIGYSAVNDHGLIAKESFSYFTNITYWSLGFYFAFAGFHTVVYSLKGRAPLQSWPVVLQFLHGLLWTTVVTFPFLVTIVFWGILAATSSPFATVVSTYTNISAHLLNSIFAVFELFITRTERPPWIHLPFLILFLAGYLSVAYITHATQGFYTYHFLDPVTGNGKVTVYCFGIAIAICVVFVLVRLVTWGRVSLTENKWGFKGKFSKRDNGGKGEAKEGMERQGVEVSKV